MEQKQNLSEIGCNNIFGIFIINFSLFFGIWILMVGLHLHIIIKKGIRAFIYYKNANFISLCLHLACFIRFNFILTLLKYSSQFFFFNFCFYFVDNKIIRSNNWNKKKGNFMKKALICFKQCMILFSCINEQGL